jgi:hypothetical protein
VGLLTPGTESSILRCAARFVNVTAAARDCAVMNRNRGGKYGSIQLEVHVLETGQTGVTTVTELAPRMGDTPLVNMVRRVSKQTLFEPDDTK